MRSVGPASTDRTAIFRTDGGVFIAIDELTDSLYDSVIRLCVCPIYIPFRWLTKTGQVKFCLTCDSATVTYISLYLVITALSHIYRLSSTFNVIFHWLWTVTSTCCDFQHLLTGHLLCHVLDWPVLLFAWIV